MPVVCFCSKDKDFAAWNVRRHTDHGLHVAHRYTKLIGTVHAVSWVLYVRKLTVGHQISAVQ
jgi:hypothetical protein